MISTSASAPCRRIQRVLAIGRRLGGSSGTRLLHALGIERADRGAVARPGATTIGQRRRVAHVVGLRLEGQARARAIVLPRTEPPQAAITRIAMLDLRASLTATVASTSRDGAP